jgi:hypothetical protein
MLRDTALSLAEHRRRLDLDVAAGAVHLWGEHYDLSYGHWYYVHGASGETVWEQPAEYVMQATDGELAAALKLQWAFRFKVRASLPALQHTNCSGPSASSATRRSWSGTLTAATWTTAAGCWRGRAGCRWETLLLYSYHSANTTIVILQYEHTVVAL